MIYKELQHTIQQLDFNKIDKSRIKVLIPLIEYLQDKIDDRQPIHLNFICTHNSRRSQMAQIWAKVAAHRNGLSISTYSGGMEVTAFHSNAIVAMKELGFKIKPVSERDNNPTYHVSFASSVDKMDLFSKRYDDDLNPRKQFAAIMTCSQADESCPFVVGMDSRISLPYEDPKAFDNQSNCISKYKECSLQIATELFYVFSQLKKGSTK